jgi:hypothetical protein
VPHQARHSLATSLLRAGATLTHVRRYLGQVSERMAEHYVHLTQSDLEDVLQRVWVAGPGTANPGELLTEQDLTAFPRERAQALAIDLSRRSTPAEGGFCTFQPVVEGGACPWNLNCHNCDKFVLSGADLLYWRRKREQWRQLAEGAPDDATADYLHRYFEPTAKAIDRRRLWPGSACLTKHSRWTCASLRTTSSAYGPPPSAPSTSPPPRTPKTTPPPRTTENPAHEHVDRSRTPHGRGAVRPPPQYADRTCPRPRRDFAARQGKGIRQRRRHQSSR